MTAQSEKRAAMPKSNKTNRLNALATKVEQVRADCEAYIDAKTEDLRRETPGVPAVTLRQIIVAAFSGCV
jgi:hypothetical protein